VGELKILDGVICNKKEKYCLFQIEDLTNEVKLAIRQEFSSICHGGVYAESGRNMYAYKNTLNEFLKRYNDKTPKIQKGMIGELLIHLLVHSFFDEFDVVSPFFNMEERSIKKGYDVVLTERLKANIWLIEVKSGELHKNKNSNQTMNDLLNTAKTDLQTRLNEENVSLWQEAINGARIAYDESKSEKDAVIDILMTFGDDASVGRNTSADKNIVVTGVLFADMIDRIEEITAKEKQQSIENSKIFKNVFVFALQKKTYEKIYCFLRNEASDEE
jgi:hypothetical protein